ncbi:MAG TPA: hypothetical protein VGS19_23845 [Streptosporangiaceae bacterium]|nr:hypothetical protein [Streptosporangiaceae bacterium]
MTGIDNTTERMRDPAEQALFLLGSMGDGPGAPIERMERDGQRQLVNSDRLPAKFNSGTRAQFEALGFTFGEPDSRDPLFVPATLPEGWKREDTDHAMWSYLLDQHGRQRVGIFYKAAFYDRAAFMNLEGVRSYVQKHVEYDGPLVITDEWATRETVATALADLRDDQLAEAAKFLGYAGDPSRDEDNRAKLREYAAEYEAKAAAYAARLEVLERDGA